MTRTILFVLSGLLLAGALQAGPVLAVLPLEGHAHRGENLVVAARLVSQKLAAHVARAGSPSSVTVVDPARVEEALGEWPSPPYDRERLSALADALGARYLLFGRAEQIYLGFRFQRLNVLCRVYDHRSGTVRELGRARYTSGRKFMVTWGAYPVLHPRRDKTFARLARAFRPFVDEIAGSSGD